jgi:hypothetical protein
MQMQKIASQRTDFVDEKQISLNTDNIFSNEAISEVNRHSLKQLLLAFLREAIFPYCYKNNTLIFDFLRSNYFLYVNNVKLFSLLRFTTFDTVVLVDKITLSKQYITDSLNLFDIVKIELGNTLNLFRNSEI